jgi:glucose/arabinose dehydrogenase
MVDPIVYYIPTFAPSGISFYSGDRHPGWKNTSLFVGAWPARPCGGWRLTATR